MRAAASKSISFQRFAEFEMLARREVQHARFARAPDFHIVVLALARRDLLRRKVRSRRAHRTRCAVGALLAFARREPILQRGDFGHQAVGLSLVLLALLRPPMSLRPWRPGLPLEARGDGPRLGIQREQRRRLRREALLGEAGVEGGMAVP